MGWGKNKWEKKSKTWLYQFLFKHPAFLCFIFYMGLIGLLFQFSLMKKWHLFLKGERMEKNKIQNNKSTKITKKCSQFWKFWEYCPYFTHFRRIFPPYSSKFVTKTTPKNHTFFSVQLTTKQNYNNGKNKIGAIIL